MRLSGRRFLNASLPLVATVVMVCCTKDAEKQKGTQHTGGGSAQSSSPEQVQKVLDKAIKLANEEDLQMNVFAQFWMDWGRKSPKPFIKNPVHLFPALVDIDPSVDLRASDNAIKFKSPFFEALDKNKFERKKFGDCLTTIAGEHKDASVSVLALEADICFSLGNLTRVPPSSLHGQVFGLVLHEASHIGGAEEPEAVAWQSEFLIFFGTRFGDLTTNTVSADTVKQLSFIRTQIAEALSWAETNPKDSRLYGEAIRGLANSLANLPNLLDPLALDLKLNPAATDLYGNYANSVLALIQKIQASFRMRIISQDGIPGSFPVLSIGPTTIVATLKDFSKHVELIEKNFSAFVRGTGEFQSTCILPAGEIDLGLFQQSAERNMIPPILPARACAR